MGLSGVLSVVGGAVVCLLLATIADIAGWIALGEIKEAIFRRGEFRKRRGRYRGLSLSAFLACGIAAVLMLIGTTAATSGRSSDADAARLFFALAAAVVAVAVILFVAWWRRAGKPRYY